MKELEAVKVILDQWNTDPEHGDNLESRGGAHPELSYLAPAPTPPFLLTDAEFQEQDCETVADGIEERAEDHIVASIVPPKPMFLRELSMPNPAKERIWEFLSAGEHSEAVRLRYAKLVYLGLAPRPFVQPIPLPTHPRISERPLNIRAEHDDRRRGWRRLVYGKEKEEEEEGEEEPPFLVVERTIVLVPRPPPNSLSLISDGPRHSYKKCLISGLGPVGHARAKTTSD